MMTGTETLIVGGTGKTGRRVAERLMAHGMPVRVGSRNGTPPFDWEDRATWSAALAGTRASYVTYYPDLALPDAAEAIAAFADTALLAGTRRLVLLSGRGEPGAQRAEQALQASGADGTILRCSWFGQNFSESFLLEPILAGDVALPADRIREPFVDAEDVADVAAAALVDDSHIGRLYELTGPRLLSFAEAIAEIAKASGRTINYRAVDATAFVAGLEAAGLPGDLIELVRLLFTEVLDGSNEYLTHGVFEALGRPPRDFADYARATAPSGIWGTSK
ncbi:NmrA family transcriptional regulator [Mesorhizobium sp. L-8-10]|nr:NmrA family transcriptional regulator [Mesorhizobium sp. L-8-10]